MKRKRPVLLWAVILASVTLGKSAGWGAPALSLEDLLSRMETQEKQIKDISFKFTQEIRILATKEKQNIKGEMIFKQPRSFYIKKTAPLEQQIISDGKSLWVYTPSYGQALVGSWSDWEAIAQFPKGLLNFQNYTRQLKERFKLSLDETPRQKEGSTFWVLRAQPLKVSKDLPYTLTLYILAEDHIPRFTTFSAESFEIETQLTDIKLNGNPKENLFKFSAPKDVDVIPLTKMSRP